MAYWEQDASPANVATARDYARLMALQDIGGLTMASQWGQLAATLGVQSAEYIKRQLHRCDDCAEYNRGVGLFGERRRVNHSTVITDDSRNVANGKNAYRPYQRCLQCHEAHEAEREREERQEA